MNLRGACGTRKDHLERTGRCLWPGALCIRYMGRGTVGMGRTSKRIRRGSMRESPKGGRERAD